MRILLYILFLSNRTQTDAFYGFQHAGVETSGDANPIAIAAVNHDITNVDSDTQHDATRFVEIIIRNSHAVLRSTAHSTAFTALPNSTSTPSPMTLNTRP